MVQRIKVNNQIHVFPDEASQEDINLALGGKTSDESQFGQIGTDIFRKLTEAPEELRTGIVETIKGLPNVAKFSMEHPGKALANIPFGIAEAGTKLFELPFTTGKYLGEKNIPYFKQLKPAYEFLTKPSSLLQSVEQKIGLGQTPEEEEIKGLAGFAIPMKGLSKLPLKSRLAAESAISASQTENPFTGPLGYEIGRGIAQAPESYSLAKNIITQGTQKALKTVPQISEITKLPEYEQRLRIANQRAEQAANKFNQQQINLGKAPEAIAQNYEEFLKQGLGLSEDPSMGMANSLNEIVKGIDSEVANLYNDVIPETAPSSILAGSRGFDIFSNIKQNLSKQFQPLKNIIEDYVETPEEKSLVSTIGNVEKLKEIPTADIVSMYKTAKQLSYRFKSRTWQEATGLTDAERNKFNEASQFFDGISSNLKDVLNSIDPQIETNLEAANNFFKNYKAPLYKRPEYWEAQKKGRISGDILKNTHARTEDAMLLRDIIGNDANFSRFALSRVLREKPLKLKTLINKDEYMPFITLNPITNTVMKGLLGLEEGKKQISRLKPEVSYKEQLQQQLISRPNQTLTQAQLQNLNSNEAQSVLRLINREIEQTQKSQRVQEFSKERAEKLQRKVENLKISQGKLKKYVIGLISGKYLKKII
jgi:hypothetical protein